jgi:hypothetical protein
MRDREPHLFLTEGGDPARHRGVVCSWAVIGLALEWATAGAGRSVVIADGRDAPDAREFFFGAVRDSMLVQVDRLMLAGKHSVMLAADCPDAALRARIFDDSRTKLMTAELAKGATCKNLA